MGEEVRILRRRRLAAESLFSSLLLLSSSSAAFGAIRGVLRSPPLRSVGAEDDERALGPRTCVVPVERMHARMRGQYVAPRVRRGARCRGKGGRRTVLPGQTGLHHGAGGKKSTAAARAGVSLAPRVLVACRSMIAPTRSTLRCRPSVPPGVRARRCGDRLGFTKPFAHELEAIQHERENLATIWFGRHHARATRHNCAQ